MDDYGKQSDRKLPRDRRLPKDKADEDSTQVPSERIDRLQLHSNSAGSELEFKKFERLIGDSLERVQSLRKGARAVREPSRTAQDSKQKAEEYFVQPKQRPEHRAADTRNPKASLFSSAETQLAESGIYQDQKVRNTTNSQQSFTVEYLLNENKQLKEEIQMILKSRSKLNETEHLVKTICQYRKLISEQEAEISLLKKYHLAMIKDREKAKLELVARDNRIELLKQQLDNMRSQKGDSLQIKNRQPTHQELDFTIDEILNFIDAIRQYYQRNSAIQDLVKCLEKQIYWSSKEIGGTCATPLQQKLAR